MAACKECKQVYSCGCQLAPSGLCWTCESKKQANDQLPDTRHQQAKEESKDSVVNIRYQFDSN